MAGNKAFNPVHINLLSFTVLVFEINFGESWSSCFRGCADVVAFGKEDALVKLYL